MRIAIFYQYYNTFDCAASGRHFTFLNHWHQQHDITLITTRTWFDQRLTHRYDWVPPGVDLHMLNVPYHNAMTPAQRLQSFAAFATKAFLKGLSIPRPDVILAVATPLTAVCAGALVAKLRRVPWVFEVQDLWPDFPIQMGTLQHPLLQKSLYTLEHWLYRDAAHLVTLSPDMETHVAGHGIPAVRRTTLLNGTEVALFDEVAEADIAALRTQYHLWDKNVVFYGGSFGRANDIPTLVAAANRLQHHADIHFVFTGQGYDEPLLQAATVRLPNVTLLSPQPKHRTATWLRLASLSLVSFIDRPILAVNSPAKFFDSLAAGTPVIVTNPGWTKQFVEKHRCGWYVPPESPDALAAQIAKALADPAALEQAGQRGATLARQQFERTAISEQMETILLNAAGKGKTSG